MTKGQKIALTIGITLVVAGLGYVAYRRFGKPRIKVEKIDDVAKEVHFTWNGKKSILSYAQNNEQAIGTNNWSFKVSRTPKGNVNGVNLLNKKGEIVETITMIG